MRGNRSFAPAHPWPTPGWSPSWSTAAARRPRTSCQLSREFHAPDIAYLAPQAAGSTWYPYSFLSPIEQNEPGITFGPSASSRD